MLEVCECLLAGSYGTDAPPISDVEADSKSHSFSYDVWGFDEEED